MYTKLMYTIALLFSMLFSFAQTDPPKLRIVPLTDSFYIYTTYNTYQNSRTPANGMYLITDEGVVMFDTPWDTTQFQPLLDSIEARHQKKVTMCLATHWHADKTAGLEYYRKLGIQSFTTSLTDELSKLNNEKRAEFLMTKDTSFKVGNYVFETYFPGEAHTKDNIVIWFPQKKILYAGCLVKGVENKNLGYLGDGNKAEYLNTLLRVKNKFRKPSFIIIAHNDWKDVNSLPHSIKMAKALKNEEKAP